MTHWHQLTDADGPADAIPVLLARLRPDSPDAAWGALWDRLYNQGAVYSASFAALSELCLLATRWPVLDRLMPLALAGAIVASNDLAAGAEEHRQLYAAAVSGLSALTVQTLRDAGLRDEPRTYTHMLQAMLAFEGNGTSAKNLSALADGECELQCPGCRAPLVITLHASDCTSSVHDFVARPGDRRLPLRADKPDDLPELGSRLYNQARIDKQSAIAEQLTYLFGHATCPRCQTSFRVSEALDDPSEFDQPRRA